MTTKILFWVFALIVAIFILIVVVKLLISSVFYIAIIGVIVIGIYNLIKEFAHEEKE